MSKILIIDNDQILVRGLRRKLQVYGHIILDAFNGISGFKLACKEKPDLIVLDVMMPIRNGFLVCEDLKNDSCTMNIPVLMLTGSAGSPEEEEKGKACADDYVVKGINTQDLIERIHKLLDFNS